MASTPEKQMAGQKTAYQNGATIAMLNKDCKQSFQPLTKVYQGKCLSYEEVETGDILI